MSRANVTVISRGGTSAWYRDIGSDYIEIFDLLAPEEFRALRGEDLVRSGSQKQMYSGRLDDEILARAGSRLGSHYAVFHPSLMYRLLWPVWTRRLPLSLWQAETKYAAMSPPVETELPVDLPALPDNFVAVKAYFSDCFPESKRNRAFLDSFLSALSEHTELVHLSAGVAVDDHRDAVSATSSAGPAANLAVQTAILARADAFVGTYGGFSYLAPYLGVSALSFYRENNFNPTHLDVMRRSIQALRRRPGVASFDVVDAGLLESVGILGRRATA